MNPALIGKLVSLLPTVLELVRLAERLIPGKGKGGLKRELVVELVTVVVLATEGISGKDLVDNKEFAEGVGKLVDAVVQIYNSIEAFQKTA